MTPREWVEERRRVWDFVAWAWGLERETLPKCVGEDGRIFAVLEAAVELGAESCERVVARGATSYVRNPLGACDSEDPHMCPPCRIRAAVAALPGEDAP